MRTRVFALVAPLVLAAAVAAGAQDGGRRGGPPGGRGGPGGPGGGRCAGTADSLTDVQRGQVKALGDAYMAAHKSQLDSLRSIMDAARAAREGGKTQDEIRAIMDLGMPINQELAPSRKAFGETVVSYLTPAQLAQGCVPPAPGGGPMGGRRGGPPPPRPPVSE